MKILTVNSFQEASVEALNIIPKRKQINIAITGGNFGNYFLKELYSSEDDIGMWEIFITDERISKNKEEQNKYNLLKKLKKIESFNLGKFNPFDQSENKDISYSRIVKKLECEDISFLDICILSLGEDGHLAGHFKNSRNTLDNRFCYTKNSPMGPGKRISFSMTWLMKSDLIILAVMGNSKKSALDELICGKGLHADLWGRKNLTLITDLDVKGLKK